MSNNQIRVRFAPSPTGDLHLGGARTALFSWAFARHNNGIFLLRIEDTDLQRSTKKAVESIMEGITWLGLIPDETPVYQTNRMERYKEVLQKMLTDGSAYYCYSSPEEIESMRELARKNFLKPKYNGLWRPEKGKQLPEVPKGRNPTIRFKAPQHGVTKWNDIVKGEIIFPNEELDDLIIARSDGTPTYNFCVAVDDWDMRISHVLRGDDHVNNTPKQINILNAMGANIPQYGHIPMILASDGEKLSKRHGAVSVLEYKKLGYLPEAMVNYLSRLGWSHKNDEIFSREELVKWFELKNLSKSSAQWDQKKLNWVNSHYIKNTSSIDLSKMIYQDILEKNIDFNKANLQGIIELFKDRANTLLDLVDSIMIFYLEPTVESLKQINKEDKNILKLFLAEIENIEWQLDNIDMSIKKIINDNNISMKELATPLRIALTGSTKTPSLNKILIVMNKDSVINRIHIAIKTNN
ncbi:glutamate--tRNA ligase [Candidatus Kinetoplastidibacterium crithidiae]|uniref:Glutamate--tRNA ligase n=2 Tax=Candidatus Kinetoplastidibacterium crithidiae TaxID=33056 RepID=M1L5H6_9PROT|nr:glutamate--tRNA ligase [Candidatus Kinetoplastibacterium crithidii]AEM25288.1 glutamyl-tRNA synthetase [Candidatus Kinetoplastibacterium crithidii]AGF47893.1 glutamyl-tRNA synthetase gltX [Candidatus Kinetoplastibacterium crithidii TCC036E]